MGFLNSSNLKIINWGNKSTFCSGSRQEVIDITLGSYGLLESIAGWEVPLEPSLSDHSHILFTLQSFMLVRLIRSPRGTNRGSFQEYLREKLERVLVMNMKDEARLGLAVHWVQQALITAYEDNCLLRPARKGRKSLRWTSELESLRRELRRLFNRCQADNSNSWELYRETQWKYRKEVQKASKTWRTFCSSVNDLPRSARLHRALSRDPKIRLGSLVAPFGECTQSKGKTLDLLLATHFPNSTVMERGAVPATACHTKGLDWQVAARIVTYWRVGWVGYSRLYCERDGRSLFLTWS